VAYNDLIELARLCLRQASAARTPAAANELRRMAKEYQARGDALMEGHLPNIQAGAIGSYTPEAPSSTVQQQQQPQEGPGDAQSSLSTPKRQDC
jgi:hypothetical protein